MSPETVEKELVPIAAELVGVVRDYGPADVAAVLARVPAGRHDALAVVLAAMVDPDARPSQLLAWMDRPVKSRDTTPRHLYVKAVNGTVHGRNPERRGEIARLTALGLSSLEIADRIGISQRAVIRHRAAIRAQFEGAA